MRKFSLDDKSAVFAFRGVICLALSLLLVHSSRQEESFSPIPFALSAAYLFTSFILWYSRSRRLNSPLAQGLSYLWDVAVISTVMYFSEGFDNELYLMYFLIMFMSGLMSQPRQSFLIGTVSSLMYACLWSSGKAGENLAAESLLLRFAFFYVVAFFTAVMAERVRNSERRVRALELRLALGTLANGGWGLALEDELHPSMDPELVKTVRTVNSLIDNLTRALQRTVRQNDELTETATAALLQLAHEKERLEASSARSAAPRS